jgi:hypothetical protein
MLLTLKRHPFPTLTHSELRRERVKSFLWGSGCASGALIINLFVRTGLDEAFQFAEFARGAVTDLNSLAIAMAVLSFSNTVFAPIKLKNLGKLSIKTNIVCGIICLVATLSVIMYSYVQDYNRQLSEHALVKYLIISFCLAIIVLICGWIQQIYFVRDETKQ